MLSTELDLQHSSVEITSSLKHSGDVELNPLSQKIMGLVQGSFNQGYVTLLGETVGRQCACNALFSICWSVVSSIVIKGTRAKDVNYFFKGVLKK